jgi:REP element-mobilizing transposase RayT
MVYNPEKHHRRSIRLKGYDYAQPGAYFITICVRERECTLGHVEDGEMVLSDLGQIAHDFWAQVSVHFPNASIDTFVVMPNHIHAVIINDPPRRGAVAAPAPGGVETTPLLENRPPHVGPDRCLLQIPDHQAHQPNVRHRWRAFLATWILRIHRPQRTGFGHHSPIHRQQSIEMAIGSGQSSEYAIGCITR